MAARSTVTSENSAATKNALPAVSATKTSNGTMTDKAPASMAHSPRRNSVIPAPVAPITIPAIVHISTAAASSGCCRTAAGGQCFDHGRSDVGEVCVREAMLGMVVVGLVAGIIVGRSGERARRSYKDWGAAKTALKKGRGIAISELRRAVFAGLLIAAALIGLFTLAMSTGASP